MRQLSVRRLDFRFDNSTILHDVSFDCVSGTFVGVLGPNGAGKSTLLKLIAGILTKSGGEILIDGVAAEKLPARERARIFAYLPQERVVHWPVSVETVVALGRLPYRSFWKPPAPEDARIVERSMERTDVLHLRARPTTRLSGGEQARVLLARLLAQDAAVLLADEPTSALDPAHQLRVMETFRSMSRQGHLVLAALHDINLASRWCDHLIVLKEGRVVADGPPAEILSRELMRSAYDVDSRIIQVGESRLVVPTDVAGKPGDKR